MPGLERTNLLEPQTPHAMVCSAFLSTIPASCGILHLGLRGLIWSRSPLPPIPGPAGAFKSSDQVEEFTDVGLQHPVLEIRR